MQSTLKDKTLFISGGSRGIGLAIALRAARDGANVAIAAKTATPHPSLPGTIHTAAEAIEAAGGRALPILCDIREEDQVEQAIASTVETFGLSAGTCCAVTSSTSSTGRSHQATPPPTRHWRLSGPSRMTRRFAC